MRDDLPVGRPTSRSSGRALDQLRAPPNGARDAERQQPGELRVVLDSSSQTDSTRSSQPLLSSPCLLHRAVQPVGVTCTTIRRAHRGQYRGGS